MQKFINPTGKNKEKFLRVQQESLQIINTFPKSKNGKNFLTLSNGRKMFFTIFLQKYGIIKISEKYNTLDILRRVRLIEFFDYFTKTFPIVRKESRKGKQQYIIESKFYRMVVLNIRTKKGASRLELLSFYHYK